MNVKKLPKIVFFSKKLTFLFNCEKFGNFFWKKMTIFVNFLTFKCQFSGGSDTHHMGGGGGLVMM